MKNACNPSPSGPHGPATGAMVVCMEDPPGILTLRTCDGLRPGVMGDTPFRPWHQDAWLRHRLSTCSAVASNRARLRFTPSGAKKSSATHGPRPLSSGRPVPTTGVNSDTRTAAESDTLPHGRAALKGAARLTPHEQACPPICADAKTVGRFCPITHCYP